MRTIKFLLAILFSLAVVACGGGGGYGGGGSMGGSSGGNGVPYSISGMVSHASVGVPGVTITLTDSLSRTTTHQTDGSGNYSFTGLNGIYTVTPTPTGIYTSFTPPSASVDVTVSNKTQNFTSP
jgi:hypothetical protein